MGGSMTQEGPKAVVSVVAEDNTKEGLDQVKRGIQETARTVVKAGQEASKGISKMGEGADQTARKLESFEKSWVNSVQRALVAAEGCAFYQGFLRAQPMPSESVLALARTARGMGHG